MKKYIVMSNMPRFMPDSDPVEFRTKTECKAYLIGEIESAFDMLSENIADVSKLEQSRDDAILHLKKHGYVYFRGYYYGVNT